MAAPRRATLVLWTTGLATLALVEAAVVFVVVLPLKSTRTDWLIATGYIAPMTTAWLLLIAAVIVRIVADILELAHRIRQWTTKSHPQPPHLDEIPSSSTPSAAPESSSCGWPSDGPSYTWPPGREENTRHEPRRTGDQVPRDHHRLHHR